MKGVDEVENEHELSPEDWQEKTKGTWFARFKSLGDFVFSCWRKQQGVEAPRFPAEFPLTALEIELKEWLESLNYFPFNITLDVAPDPAFLRAYVDTPEPEWLFVLSRDMVVESYMETVKSMCVRMIEKYRAYYMYY